MRKNLSLILFEGIIQLGYNQRLDFERQQMYQFSVVAEDGGLPMRSSSVPVSVRVLNVNDETPQVSLYKTPGGSCGKSSHPQLSAPTQAESNAYYVCENEPVGTTVAHMDVIDQDPPGTKVSGCVVMPAEYRWQVTQDIKDLSEVLARVPANDRYLDIRNDQIVTRMVLDRETQKIEHFVVMCFDQGTPPLKGIAELHLLILDRFLFLLIFDGFIFL